MFEWFEKWLKENEHKKPEEQDRRELANCVATFLNRDFEEDTVKHGRMFHFVGTTIAFSDLENLKQIIGGVETLLNQDIEEAERKELEKWK